MNVEPEERVEVAAALRVRDTPIRRLSWELATSRLGLDRMGATRGPRSGMAPNPSSTS
jgi:hypothetical protein